MKKLLNVFIFIWMIPQNICGLIYWLLLLVTSSCKSPKVIRDAVYISLNCSGVGSVSLGQFIFVSADASKRTYDHEYGHYIQGLYLGPLYLLVIGIPSITWASVYKYTNRDYYSFYTERWANNLMGLV